MIRLVKNIGRSIEKYLYLDQIYMSFKSIQDRNIIAVLENDGVIGYRHSTRFEEI